MGKTRPRQEVERGYERTAREYAAGLTSQRLIFLVAFRVIGAARPEVQAFNELLIQYDFGRPRRRRQVVPDNVAVAHPEPLPRMGSFDAPLMAPARPFLVAGYVSPGDTRKDYEESHDKYEKELKVPCYLRFYPANQELSLFRHNGRRYVSATPDGRDRYAIPELDVELGLVDGWVRFWFRGELMAMPSEFRQQRDEARGERDEARGELQREQLARQAAEAEVERLTRLLAERERP